MLRFLWLVGFSLWVGGFVFYTSFVVPVLISELGESAIVTRHIAVVFNRLGALVLAYWAFVLWVERRQPTWRRTGVALVLVNVVVQAGLFWAYEWVREAPQEMGDPDFYFRHRIYLWLHTVQFLLAVGSLAVSLRRWRLSDAAISGTGSAA